MRKSLQGWRLGVAVTVALILVYTAFTAITLISGIDQRDQRLRALRQAAVAALPAGSHLVGSGFIAPDRSWAVGTLVDPTATGLAGHYSPGGADGWSLIDAAAVPGERNFLNTARTRLLNVRVSPCKGGDCPPGGSRIEVSIVPGGTNGGFK